VGTNQLTIGPNPNLVLTSYMVSRDTLHTSCALFYFVTGRRIPARGTPLAEDTRQGVSVWVQIGISLLDCGAK
jgi:hypothetical protein